MPVWRLNHTTSFYYIQELKQKNTSLFLTIKASEMSWYFFVSA